MKVVLISLDALFDQDLPLMRQQPFFGEFLAHASGCTHVRTVYPALTYPAHTTLVTGVDPRQHGIGHNQPHHPELEASMRPWYWDRAQVKVPNLFDAVKEAGGSCASVLWPVTGKTKSIRWNFPEVLALPGENQTWKMLRYGSPLWLLQMELRHRSERVSLREPYLSDYATILLKDVIASHAPDLSAVHLVDLDDMRHHHGVFNRETRKAIQRLDHRAAEIWETMQHTPGMEGAALCLVSDHGQADVRETVSLGEALTRLGLGSLFTVQSNGFGAYLFFRQKEEEEAHLGELTDFLRQHLAELRASAVYSAEDLAAMGAVEGVFKGTGIGIALCVILFDYLIAFTVLGLGGLFKGKIKNAAAALALGSVVVSLLRLVAHFISGYLFFGSYAEWFFSKEGFTLGETILSKYSGNLLAAIYSLFYNASYMIPEMIITAVVAAILGAALKNLGDPQRKLQ